MARENLAHYEVLELIGKGGMGEVYRARDRRLDREVALKILPPEMAADPERLSRFEREARAVAKLNHPNIVTLHSVEESEGRHFLSMELVRGKPLSEVIPEGGLSFERILELALPLADALATAHGEGIVHRDLKPANVMIGDDGRLKVMDFGLAKLREPQPDGDTRLPTVSITEEGRVLGTVSYMSPEQAEGKPVDHRSDIFSLGVVLHEMATGTRPFRGDSPASVVSSILRDTPEYVSRINPSLPRQFGRIVRHCLQKDPEKRCQTAKELRNELLELKEEVDSGIALSVGAGRSRTRGKRTGGLVPVLIATVVLAAAAAGFLWIDRHREAAEVGVIALKPTFTRLTSWPGEEITPSLSPDGKSFVFASKADGDWDLYFQRVGGAKAINLTEDCPGEDLRPAFSPDGESIAFDCSRDGGGIFVMGATGESKRRVTDFGGNAVWSPDGRQLLFSSIGVSYPYSRGRRAELWTVDAGGGEPRRIFEGDSIQPGWSPDGRRIAYWSVIAGQRDVWTLPASGGTPVPVTQDAATDWNPAWSPAGTYLYFSSDRGGSMNLWRVPVDTETGEVTGEPEPVTTGATASRWHLTLSADGRTVAYVEHVEIENIVRLALDPNAAGAGRTPEAVTQGTLRYTDPDVSPDGKSVAFTTSGAQEDICITGIDGTGLRCLTDDPYKDRRPRWSPDGRTIAFYSNRSGSYEIWLVNADGSGLRAVTEMPDHNLVYPVWSPDGARLALLCSTHGEIFVTDLFGSAEQLPEPTLAEPGHYFSVNAWSPDGRWLAGSDTRDDFTDAGIVVYSLDSGEYVRLADFGGRPVWIDDGRRLLFYDREKLHRYDFESRRLLDMVTIGPLSGFFGVGPGGKWVYFGRSTSEADVWLMDLG